MDIHLNNQIVLISGSSLGIGRGIAESFLQEGCIVIMTGRNKIILENSASELSNKYGENKVLYFSGDLNVTTVLNSLHQFINDKLGGLNHIVCNVGSGKSVPPLDEDTIEFQRMLDINILNAVGVVSTLHTFLKLKTSKNNYYPSITFVSSICGVETLGCPVAYASSKSALISYAKNISFPFGRKGVRVNVVSPGNIMFPGSTWEKKMGEDSKKVENMLKKEVPLQCFGDIDDVANAVVFLASKRAKFVNGENLVIDGGQTRS